jgi:hypothetical protein
MKTLISTSAIAFAAIVSASSAFACANCNVALTATTEVIPSTCEFTTASTTGTYDFAAATTSNPVNRFRTNGLPAQRGAIGIKTRGNSAVIMEIDPTLYTNDGSTAIAGVRLTANYNPTSNEGLDSEVINNFTGATEFRDNGGANSKFGIDVSARTRTDIVTFKVGGIAVLASTTEGGDPMESIDDETSYTIKHVVTCTQ